MGDRYTEFLEECRYTRMSLYGDSTVVLIGCVSSRPSFMFFDSGSPEMECIEIARARKWCPWKKVFGNGVPGSGFGSCSKIAICLAAKKV